MAPSCAFAATCLAALVPLPLHAQSPDPNSPGILEPSLSAVSGTSTRIPNTDQAAGGTLLNVVGAVRSRDVRGESSLLGHVITRVESPNRDMREALDDLAGAAQDDDDVAMQGAAEELRSILLGTTQGRIYDGFAMLNHNRGAFVPDHLPGEYKTKLVEDSGATAVSIDGRLHTVWEATVNMLWYDGQFDSDTFLLRVPVEADAFDLLRLHFRIYSLETEDFAPTCVLVDHRLPGSVQFPFKGLDSVWVRAEDDSLTEVTVDFPPLRLLRGVYTWGWREHPPRIQFLQPIFETVNAHTGQVELEPEGKSFAARHRSLTIDDIGDAAPEKKMYDVCQAVLSGATPAAVLSMLEDPATAPRGTWPQWADLAEDQIQLPPEARDVLEREGVPAGEFGDYRFVSVYLNNEMYGDGPRGRRIEAWEQGERFEVKVVNLDDHTHYFRNVDFGPRLHDDIRNGFSSGSHSFEIMNFKPSYGAPKVAEMQWRAGWGFRPHFDVIQQQDVFPRATDRELLKGFTDGRGRLHRGWQHSSAYRGGDFRFDPPPFIIGDAGSPAPFPLREEDGSDGLVIGRRTQGYGVAKMCSHAQHPYPGFCETDVSAFNPNGVYNVDTDGDGVDDELWFPPFLRNPDPSGGDIIPPTPAWKPFLWINPSNGTLFLDPNDPDQGYWVDRTYAHGRPVFAGDDVTAEIEAPRAAGQVFYQFDVLFHDNAIFSPHPTDVRRVVSEASPTATPNPATPARDGARVGEGPRMRVDASDRLVFSLSAAEAGAPAFLLASGLSATEPPAGETPVARAPLAILAGRTDEHGELSLELPLPATTADVSFVFFAARPDGGLALSNAVRLTAGR